MSEIVKQVKLDTVTTTVRFITGAAPKLATRVVLGSVCTVEDVIHDEAMQLLVSKVGAAGAVVGVGIKNGANNTASFFSSKIEESKTPEAQAARAQALEKAKQVSARIPGFGRAKSFINGGIDDLRKDWEKAHYANITEVESQIEAIDSAISIHMDDCVNCQVPCNAYNGDALPSSCPQIPANKHNEYEAIEGDGYSETIGLVV